MVELLEGPLLRVPFESLKRAAKDRKALIDEAAECVAALRHPLNAPPTASVPATAPSSRSASVAAPSPTPAPDAAGDTEMVDAPSELPAPNAEEQVPDAVAGSSSREASIERLRLLLSQLQGAKRKLKDVSRAEADDCQRCKARLEYLAASPKPTGGEPDAQLSWTRQRLDLLLVDHLLRSGYHESAARLVADSKLAQLTDGHIFEGARRVVGALMDAHDCGPALAWCAENRARLSKAKSPLEFKLRVQQFLELVRSGDRVGAIAHARAHLAPWAGTYMAELQRAVATLVFTPATRVPAYASLFAEGAWRSLADLFLRDLYRLNSLTPESLLMVYLQAGLSALKTPLSGEAGGSREDPLRLPAFQRLAEGLPYAKHMHSKLVCAVTKEIMTDANPPMVLPNGMVYSQRGVEQLMAQQEAQSKAACGGAGVAPPAGAAPGGWGVCPVTGLVFKREELRRAYVA
ncbi:hypothetical protein GPECTOR_40g555 [Gonium pectorale]|uniref:CTLH domain-containing protein n=1 Tax=Gonium pectorale TaxID=33097 RepID=A0A150GAF2_GONPE|nr:hypothetical protein GPECTOR_40g555 [Gonium pectorale]|eukprot:KXZ46821.1 hypothetical protein GPECTOR_40g555 [Gonium pectorale]